MTWLSLVTTVTLIFGFVATGLFSSLGVSLRAQGTRTTKQRSNRRMLTAAAVCYGIGILVPFLVLGWTAAAFFALGWAVLALLIAAMFSSRQPTRLLAVLAFLSAALFAVVALPPHRGTFDAVAAFLVAGLVLSKGTRMATRRHQIAGQFG